MKHPRRRTLRSSVAIPIALALLLAACGGGDGDDNASTGSDRETTTTIEAETTTSLDEGTTDTTEATSDTTIAETGTTLPGGSPTTTFRSSSGPTTTAKRTTTTIKRSTATTAKPTATTAPTNEGPPKNITGMEVPAGQPIKLGILGALPTETGGNVERMYEIALDSLRKNGQIPVNGRDIVPYFRGWSFLDPNGAALARAACTSSAQDDKVFAALVWAVSPECLAADFKVPTFGGGITDEAMARAFPYAFSIAQSTNDSLKNLSYWADDRGLLKGRKLGMYYGSQAGRKDLINDQFKPNLRKLGYTLTEELQASPPNATDAAADRVAVQRFKAAGVDTIFLTQGTPGEFGKAARAQGYRPKFIFGASETSLICAGCPARLGLTSDMFDGTPAMSGGRVGEDGTPGNPPTHPAGVKCAENYEKFSGERVRQTGTAFEQQRWQAVQWSCVQTEVLVDALKVITGKLTQGALINAYETETKGVQSGFFADISFTRTNHFGSNQLRTLQLDGECLCWKVKTPLRPLYVT